MNNFYSASDHKRHNAARLKQQLFYYIRNRPQYDSVSERDPILTVAMFRYNEAEYLCSLRR